MSKNLFGTSGIRGFTHKEISKDFARGVALAFGQFLTEGAKGNKKTVCVGRDTRPDADKISAAAIEGLAHAGIDVIDYGIVPTPELSFHLTREKMDGSIMITGSHLPIGMLGIIPMLRFKNPGNV